MRSTFASSLISLILLLVLGCSSEDASTRGGSGGTSGTDGSAGGGGQDPMAITTIQIEVGELTFDARVAGPEDGEVVFLLHGFPETSHEWRDVLPALGGAGYRAVAPDQRGYSAGARPVAIADYAVPELVGDVVGMADALGAERFHVAGHDWGAAVAWAVAAAAADRVLTVSPMSVPHPDAFSSLLSDPASDQYTASAYVETFSQADFEDVMLANDAAGLRGAYSGFDPAVVDEYLRVLGTKEALGAALNWYRANFDGRVPKGGPIGPTTVPTLFIWSDADIFLVREGAELTADYVTAPYAFEIVAGVDHWLVDREPERVAEFLIEHLDR